MDMGTLLPQRALTEQPFFQELSAGITNSTDGQELGKCSSWVRQTVLWLIKSLKENSLGVVN